MSEWQKVTKSETHNFEISNEISGVYVNKKENVGTNNSNIYEIEVGDELVGVWGSTVLDNKMANVKIGEEVKIVYLGKATNERTKRSYKNFEVFHRSPAKSDDLDIAGITFDDLDI